MKNKLFFFIQAILRYLPFKIFLSMRSLIYPFFFKSFGKNVRIFDSVVIKYPNEIEIGDNVTINQFCYVVGKGGLIIGSNSMFGSGTKITTSSHNFEDTDKPMAFQGVSFDRIEIGEDVWAGFNVVILGGAKIGKSSILATSTVVTGKEYPEYSVVAGVPGRIIKNRLDK